MASTQTLRQHNQNQARPEDTRNAKPLIRGATAAGSKPPNPCSVSHATKKGAENRDPLTQNVKATAAGKHVGTSRLPVLARSQPLQSQTDFTQVHRKWAQSFKKGTAQKKKPCTKPVPFSLSQPKTSRAATANQLKTQPTDAGAPKLTCRNASELPRQGSGTAPSIKLSAASHNGLPVSVPHPTLPLRAPMVPVLDEPCREVCVRPAGLTDGLHFSPDPVALDSILQNEGVKSRELLVATPKSSVCPTGRGTSVYMPQRVSVLRTQPRPPGGSAVGAVQFSPDPAALYSILQNKGVNAEGPLGATPRASLCPTGRGTSMYMPQRVPVTKGHSEAAGARAGLSQTPAVKWTPQRVPNTRPQSAMRHLSAHRSSIFRGSPTLRSLLGFGKDLGPRKEEPVVQKLFEEAEQESLAVVREENVTDGQNGQPVFQQAEVVTETSTQQGHTAPPDSDSFLSLRPLPAPGCAPPAPPPEALPPPHLSLGGARGGIVHRVPHLRSTQRPPLEECLLDEECAMFTSRPSSASACTRCADPVASVLLLQTSTYFEPIDLPPLSTMQEFQPICRPVLMSA
ncbi:uncharacterized protein troap isoform X2 [Conger conger]|uniref:uncharacterized protein troap isoform X2 n=1 Tax=Conger conger TaxID=82655 RepID=UPI002A5A492F|nr:uncharacterized protein troap isoform X2 [Conger conger]